MTLTDRCTAVLENALANVQDNTDAVWPGTVVVRRLDLLHWAPANDGKSVCAGMPIFCKQRIQIATLVFWAGIWVGILHGFGIFFLRTFVDLSGHWIIWSVGNKNKNALFVILVDA